VTPPSKHRRAPEKEASSLPHRGADAGSTPSSATPQPPAPAKPSGRHPADPQTTPAPTGEPERTRSQTPTNVPAQQNAPDVADQPALSGADIALGVGSVGGLLAAAVVAGLALRRRTQLQLRPVGRRIAHPPLAVQAVETALGHRQTPLTPRTLDLAIRAIAAHCRNVSAPLPPLTLAKVSPSAIELTMGRAARDAPVGFRVRGRSWILEGSDAQYLSSVPGIEEAARPYPALVSLGRDGEGSQVLADLEGMGLLALDADDPALSEAVLAAMAVELSFSPWADEMTLTLVGSSVDLPQALGKHNVTATANVDELLGRLERRAIAQRPHQEHRVLGQNRVDPDLADPWAPEIVLVNQTLTDEQQRRLVAVVMTQPRVSMAAVVARPTDAAPWSLSFTGSCQRPTGSGDAASAVLQPLGLELMPQLLEAQGNRAMFDLVSATGTEETSPAPWWHRDDDPPAHPPPDKVSYRGKRFYGWGNGDADETGRSSTVAPESGEAGGQLHHPILRLLGPVELAGTSGAIPPRAAKQCLEYCGWLLENPGATAQAMASALVVAEGTRRSNMSRLRTWLGSDSDGRPYLPDAYTGRIVLHPSVSSDWQRLQILTAAGVNKASTGGLRAALELVRGAPLADAAPGQWHWAEELRTDMISAIRDLGVELSSRALVDRDIDLARWAASRALAAAPGDELLMAARIRTEHLAGNTAETERLTLQVASQSTSTMRRWSCSSR
jgi:hypothetical protein